MSKHVALIWKYYRAADTVGKTVDFLLTAKRDKAAATRFFDKAMRAMRIVGALRIDR